MDMIDTILSLRKDAVVPLGVTSWTGVAPAKAYGVEDSNYAKAQHTATLVQEGATQKIIIIGGTCLIFFFFPCFFFLLLALIVFIRT